MKGKTIFYSGIALVAVSIIMAIWGIHMFTYRGDFNNIMSITGQYSFILCGPFFSYWTCTFNRWIRKNLI